MMTLMIRLVFSTDFRYYNSYSRIPLKLLQARMFFLRFWWGVKVKIRSGPYKLKVQTTLVSPKCHKVGQRRWGSRRG